MHNVVYIGTVPWTRKQMRKSLSEFVSLYKQRPIKDNAGGMKAPHMFLVWFLLKQLNPKVIVESGVWYGQGTWLFEQACPDAQLHCIDINLSRIKYKSERAFYYDHDFATIDWSSLPKQDTLLFFDDHQNAFERVKTAKRLGFTHLIFEDNYPPSQGDCYSLKKVFSHAGFIPAQANSNNKQKFINTMIKFLKLQASAVCSIPPNSFDAQFLEENIDVYYEMPPVFKAPNTRWGDRWDDVHYPTPEPLLYSIENEYQRIFLEEAVYYTWMCYVKLKHL